MGVVGTVGAVSLSVVSSVSIVICNKALMSAFGFIFATTLASWHLLFAFCSLHVALCMKLFEHKPFDARTVMGFGVLKGISVGLLNLSLSYNSVGFYQMTKLAVIPCTAILETLFFRKFSRYIQLSLGVLLFGVGVATVTDPQLNAMGFVLSLLALITTCIAQIITKTIQKKFELSSTQLLYQSCPYQALTLFVVGPFLDGFLTNKNVFAFEYTPQVLFFIVLSCLLSFSMYFSSALLIGKTSAVTDLVLGHLKIWLVLAFGYVVLHDPFSWRNILGKLIAVVGIGLYSYCTSAPSLVMASPTLKKKKKKVMASPVLLPNRVKLLYKGHQILNVILGILIGLIAVLRWYTGRADFDSTVILMCLVNSSMLFVLPQSMISIYCFFQKGRCVGLEAYIWTAAMVLDDYVALLMINIEYISIVMIPGMILVLIGTLGWKLRKSTMEAEKHQTNEEILSVEKTNSSDKLVLFEFVSYLLQLSLVTWTQYKGQQGSTPVLSDFLLFLCSALGAFGVMLDSPLGGVNSREVSSVQVLPVLHKTCTVVLFIAVHTLAAEWLGEDMIYVCLPELLVVLVWFTICFGESMSVSSFTSHKSELIMVSSVVAILAGLISLNANDRNMRVTWIIWAFWISLSSSAFSQFHVWLLHGWPHGWPGSSSESNKLIRLLKVASTVGSSTAAILCAYMMVTDPRILYEAISSFEHKAIAALVPIIFLLTFLVWSAHLETQIHKIPVSRKLSDMLENKLHRKLYKLLKALKDALPSGVREDITFLQVKLEDMHPIITCFEW